MTPTKQLPADFQAAMLAEMDKLPYIKHLDDGQYNDGQILGFQKGAEWAAQYLPRWIPVEERLPDTHCEVLVVKKNGNVYQMSFHAPFDSGERIFQWWGFGKWIDQHTQVTHWQPLPTPPEK